MLKRPAFVHIKINSLSTKPASHQGITYFPCINKWFGYNRSYENDKDNLLAINQRKRFVTTYCSHRHKKSTQNRY